jgi:hypothetical protein
MQNDLEQLAISNWQLATPFATNSVLTLQLLAGGYLF